MKNLALFLLLLAACTPAAKPIAAPSAETFPTLTTTLTITSTPAPTNTPVPPHGAHEWTQSKPLITFTRSWGALPTCCFERAIPPDLTLLPSGDLYLFRQSNNSTVWEILTTTLSRQATCNLLNAIDQAGFYDYDPSTYYKENIMPGGTDAPGTFISVQAWRANSVTLTNLTDTLRRERENQVTGMPAPMDPTILPAIRDTFRLLDQYRPPALHALKPERVGVWLYGPPSSIGTNQLMEWPLKSDTLAAVVRRGLRSDSPAMILTGADAAQVYYSLHQSFNIFGMNVREGDKLYHVFVRPLLQNEFNTSPLPQVSLSCSPSDGWIQTP